MKKILFSIFLLSLAIVPAQAAIDSGAQDDYYGQQDDIYGYADDTYGRNDDLYGTIDSAYGAIDDLYGYIDDQEGKLDGLPNRTDLDIQAEIDRANKGIKTIQGFIDVSYEKAESFAGRIAQAGASMSVLQGIMAEIDHEIASLKANVESVHSTFEFGTAYDVSGSVDLIYARVSDSYGLISDLWGVADDLVGVLDGIQGNTDAKIEALLKELKKVIQKIDDNVQAEYPVANGYYKKISDAWSNEDRLYELKAEIEAEAERFYGKNLTLAENITDRAKEITSPKNDTHCPQVYTPVCGKPYTLCAAANTSLCEKNGKAPKTYSNRCELEKYHAEFLYDGECVTEENDEESGNENEEEEGGDDEAPGIPESPEVPDFPEDEYYEDAEDGTIEKWFQYPPDKSGIPQSMIENIYNEEIQSRVISYESFGGPVWLRKEEGHPEKPVDPVVGMKVKTEKTKAINLQYGIQTDSNLEGIASVASIEYKITPDIHNGEWTSVEYNLKQDLRKQDLELFGLEDEREILSVFTLKIHITETQAEENEGLALFDDIKM